MHTHESTHKGTLEVICGPMFSGKSEELMRRLRRAKIAKQNVITFKPSIDNRHSIEHVVSHDGNKLYAQAIDIENISTILDMVRLHHFSVIGIDEVQFFPQSILSVICTLIDEGKRIIVAGLDLDFRGVPFGAVPTLLAIADKITKLNAICCMCGADATCTQRLINNKPAHFDDPVILVGAQEAYQARCKACFSIDKTALLF
jgi:thymidine kinase